jgi:hypothetical protein
LVRPGTGIFKAGNDKLKAGDNQVRLSKSWLGILENQEALSKPRSSRGNEAQTGDNMEPPDVGCYGFETRSQVRDSVYLCAADKRSAFVLFDDSSSPTAHGGRKWAKGHTHKAGSIMPAQVFLTQHG